MGGLLFTELCLHAFTEKAILVSAAYCPDFTVTIKTHTLRRIKVSQVSMCSVVYLGSR